MRQTKQISSERELEIILAYFLLDSFYKIIKYTIIAVITMQSPPTLNQSAPFFSIKDSNLWPNFFEK